MPIDFKKLAEQMRNQNPEEREAERNANLEKEEWYQYKKKIEALHLFGEQNSITPFEEKFIRSVYSWVCLNFRELSQKQKSKVDEFYCKYFNK